MLTPITLGHQLTTLLAYTASLYCLHTSDPSARMLVSAAVPFSVNNSAKTSPIIGK